MPSQKATDKTVAERGSGSEACGLMEKERKRQTEEEEEEEPKGTRDSTSHEGGEKKP